MSDMEAACESNQTRQAPSAKRPNLRSLATDVCAPVYAGLQTKYIYIYMMCVFSDRAISGKPTRIGITLCRVTQSHLRF